ncbi:MAG: asparagine synthase (glutamine-hydrolyzing) [Lachnospiraceae bacterium]|nr:asparagine synthase (glutamine-hydrolyzing) [Lachnospiraceae bacterium]
MCGIAGVISKNGYARRDGLRLLKKMTDALSHRGPDGEGQRYLSEGMALLGHRRLSVIDLSESASQPMQSADGRYTISYNGEVYNYKELRAMLSAEGIGFFSDSDTEVVLNAVSEWGIENTLSKLNGMFAFAVWDSYTKELILARDRYGIKPVYYAIVRDNLIFASEYKAILCFPDFYPDINREAIFQYFTFQNIIDDSTFFDGIKILPAGCYMRVNPETVGAVKPIKYWEFDFSEKERGISSGECEEELDRLFTQAVRRQLVSDVPVGAYLSGGIDSGAITCIAAREIPDIKSFTCGIDLHSASGIELSYDERDKAEYMSYLFGTEHYEIVLKNGDMERCMEKLVWHLEDPRVGQSYPNFYAANLSSRFVKVILGGIGGDELFAGYPWRYYKAVGAGSEKNYIRQYYGYWQRLLNRDELAEVLSPIYEKGTDLRMEDYFRQVYADGGLKLSEGDISFAESLNASLFFEAKTFLHGLLIVEDKISMAHGLETRVPFLDNDLVEFALKIPVKYKLRGIRDAGSINENDLQKKTHSYQRTNDGKLILRKVMKRYVPSNITDGPKQGFAAPDSSWFKGESIDFVESVVNNPCSMIYEFLNQKAVKRIFEQHKRGEQNRRLFIWSVLNFEYWLRLFYARAMA